METKRIRKLDQETINKIAAGEVLQRPANALKELIENSLDAKATSIAVTVLNGGLKSLIVSDNGIGINKQDLDIVCERFTTSKLSKFSDLSTISTFGFRGEALASMTHVGHVTIRTKTKDQDVAWLAKYRNGKLLSAPNPIAGNQGTIITIEDLFYNVPTRKNAFKNLNEEYSRILDVCQKYSIHYPKVAFMCKKHGTNSWDICTPANSTVLSNIGLIYGKALMKELIPVGISDSSLEFKTMGFISNANYSEKKFTFILFINEHGLLKKSIEALYNAFLPKGTHPFVYLSLTLKSQNLDVNVHPTKQQVNFLYEDFIVEKISDDFSSCLANNNSSRTFLTQSLLPQSMITEVKLSDNMKTPVKQPEHKLVRTDSASRTLDSFLTTQAVIPGQVLKVVDFNAESPHTPTPINAETKKNSHEKVLNLDTSRKVANKYEIVDVQLLSILELRQSIENKENSRITEMFREHTFVGLVDDSRALIQHQTRLLMVEFREISKLFFYQVILYGFANFSRIIIDSPLRISDILMASFAVDPSLEEDNDTDTICKLLIEKREMLSEYFSLDISPEGDLLSLPVLLKGFTPNLTKLPLFLIAMANDVDWTCEKPCFKSIAKVMSQLYKFERNPKQELEDFGWSVEHLLFPALKSHFVGPNELSNGHLIVELAQLPDLYKIFERC